MRKKTFINIFLFFVVSMFMTSCIFIETTAHDDDGVILLTNVAWQTYSKNELWEYENENGEMYEGMKKDIITFHLENGFWTTEYRSPIDTTKKMVYFDYSFDTPYGTIYIGDNEWFDESYSFTYHMESGTITLYSNDGDTLKLSHLSGW